MNRKDTFAWEKLGTRWIIIKIKKTYNEITLELKNEIKSIPKNNKLIDEFVKEL